MLSVNIPVYNVEVGSLVGEVSRQAELAGIVYEILIYDDGSEALIRQKNRQLTALDHVVYKEMPENLGRSAIRNRMGFESQYKYLLFIDADSCIDADDYIRKYLNEANPGCVICGGTKYSGEIPEDQTRLLRWVYGSAREAVPAKERNLQKGFIITSNNFLIDRQVFEQIHFRENIGPYGHEDTLLGYDLFTHNYVPVHIDNPVVHEGLEDALSFLNKTRQALENLIFIERYVVPDGSRFRETMRFLKLYNRLIRYIPVKLLGWSFRLCRGRMEKNLTGVKPKLLWFDLYKVGYFSTLKSRNQD